MDTNKKEKTMKDRSRIEQDFIEQMITNFFDRYLIKSLDNEKFEDDSSQGNDEEEEDLENAISHFILKAFHEQYLIKNLRSTGIFDANDQ